MTPFATMTLPENPTVFAADGSDVRVLLGLEDGGFAHFELGGRCDIARAPTPDRRGVPGMSSPVEARCGVHRTVITRSSRSRPARV